MLIVQHSDRLARGNAKQARHLVEIVTWAIKHDVTIRSFDHGRFERTGKGIDIGKLAPRATA